MASPIHVEWYNRPGAGEYGAWRVHGDHDGYDTYCNPLATIYGTAENGVVIGKGYVAGGWGHYIDVRYPDYTQRDCHMAEASGMHVGWPVSTRTALGRVGQTGNAKGIAWYVDGWLWHVHSEVYLSQWVNFSRRTNPLSVWGVTTAGGKSIPITDEEETKTEEEDDMKPDIIGHKNEEVAVLAPWLPNGYLTAKVGTEVAIGWARRFSPTKDSLVPMYDRATYLGMIAGAKALADGYQAALPKSGVAVSPPVVSGGASKADLDAAAARIIEQIPTVFRSGQA